LNNKEKLEDYFECEYVNFLIESYLVESICIY